MADWVTISSLATAAGTLVLAAATFGSVRSARRSTAVTERALLAQIRPVLVGTRITDPPEKVGFIDDHWMRVEGQHAQVDVTSNAIYMAFTVRNVGAGVAILDRWAVSTDDERRGDPPGDPEGFRRLTRDIFVPAGDIGCWQGALREPETPEFRALEQVVEQRRRFYVDLLYEDHEGGQRTITRFGLVPVGEDAWLTAASRQWNLDRDDPRPD
jgi:hypothetical protein